MQQTETHEIPQIDPDACTVCGRCLRACPASVLEFTERGLEVVRPEACSGCQACEEACPSGALTCGFEIRFA